MPAALRVALPTLSTHPSPIPLQPSHFLRTSQTRTLVPVDPSCGLSPKCPTSRFTPPTLRPLSPYSLKTAALLSPGAALGRLSLQSLCTELPWLPTQYCVVPITKVSAPRWGFVHRWEHYLAHVRNGQMNTISWTQNASEKNKTHWAWQRTPVIPGLRRQRPGLQSETLSQNKIKTTTTKTKQLACFVKWLALV